MTTQCTRVYCDVARSFSMIVCLLHVNIYVVYV